MTDDDILDIVTDDDGSLPDQPDKAVRGVGGYRFITILLFLFAAGGLFLGLLGTLSASLVGFTAKINSQAFWGLTASKMNECLMGLYIGTFENMKAVWEIIKGVYTSPFNFDAVAQMTVQLLLMLLLTVAVITSIIAMIVSLISRKRAKSCAVASLTLNLIAYGGIFIYCFAMTGISYTVLGAKLSFWEAIKKLTDAAPGIVAIVALVALIIMSIAQRKEKIYGFLNFLLVVFSLLSILAFFYLGTITANISYGAFEGMRHHLGFFTISLVALLALMFFNFYVTCSRVRAQKGYVFDVVRLGVQMIALVLVIVAWALDNKGSEMEILKTPFYTYPILMMASTFLAFLMALLMVITVAVRKRRANKPEKKEEAEEEKEEEESLFGEEEPFIEPEPALTPAPAPAPAPQPVIAKQEVKEEAPAPVAKQETKPEPVPQQAVQPQPEQPPFAPTYNITYVTPQQQQQPQPQPAVQPVAQPQPAPQPERPKTDFELYMEALAKGHVPAAAPAQETSAYKAPAYIPPKPVQQPTRPAPVQNNYYSQYTYDPFISTLNAAETNEFCDLFIGNKNGALSYLPAYVIGGDNADFFRKIFIYLGRYRKDITRELLEKIYLYVPVNYPAEK